MKSIKKISGYTLIEILIVLAIMGVLFVVGYAGFRDFSRREQVNSALLALMGDIRAMQQLNLSGKKPFGCTGVLKGYSFEVLSPNSYKTYANCGTNETTINIDVKTVNLPDGITINTPTPNPIYFKSVGQGTNITATVDATLTLTQATTLSARSLYISSTGELREDSGLARSGLTPTPSVFYATSTPKPSFTPTPIPIAHWKLDETSGQTVIDSISNFNGTMGSSSSIGSDDPTRVVGKLGNALSFDGSNDYVTIPHVSALNFGKASDVFTINLWFKTATAGRGIFSKARPNANVDIPFAVTIGTADSKLVYFRWCEGCPNTSHDVRSVAVVTDNNWHMGTIVLNGASSHLMYIDGNLSTNNTTNWTGFDNDNTQPFEIGRYANFTYGTTYFNGVIDDIRIFNKALTPAEISGLFIETNTSIPTPIPTAAPTAAPTPPPPPTGWVYCAPENGYCSSRDSNWHTIRYGAGSSYIQSGFPPSGTGCNNQVFGDPAPGVVKHCDIFY